MACIANELLGNSQWKVPSVSDQNFGLRL